MFYGDILFYSILALYFLAQSGLFDFGTFFDGATTDGAPNVADETYQPRADFNVDDFADVAIGTSASDTFTASGGESALAYFMKGSDDSLIATAGNDYADGGAGDDLLTLRDGDDIAHGGAGDDALRGGTGNDTLYGDAGNDTLFGHGDDDTLYGGAGNDTIEGGYGDDNIFGGEGDDVLSGDGFSVSQIGRGIDTLDGGAGDDVLWLADGDTGTGGEGADQFQVYEVTDPDADSAFITDYDPTTDSLQIHYIANTDPDTGADLPPDVSVTYDGDNDNTRVEVNGKLIARLNGEQAITADDIDFQPLA